MNSGSRFQHRFLLRAVFAPIPAVVIGAIVMMRAGVPAAAWGQNLAATALCAVLLLATRNTRRSASSTIVVSRFVVLALLALLGVTLFHRGMEGVHRWIVIGRVQLHAGAVVLPLMLVLLARLDRASSVGVGLVALCILWLQPDAAQACAFAIGWSVLEATRRGRSAVIPIVVASLIAPSTLARPDALPAVAHVEGIVGMAADAGPVWALLGIVALGIPPIVWLSASGRAVGWALAAYLTVTLLASWLGNFPVPFLGYGVSPILGHYLAVAACGRAGVDPAFPSWGRS